MPGNDWEIFGSAASSHLGNLQAVHGRLNMQIHGENPSSYGILWGRWMIIELASL